MHLVLFQQTSALLANYAGRCCARGKTGPGSAGSRGRPPQGDGRRHLDRGPGGARLWKVFCRLAGMLPLVGLGAANEPAVGEWPMFRGNPALSGVTSESLPDRLNLLWSFKTAGPVKSSPAISRGKVFVGSADGYVYCLKIEDGTKEWAFKTGGEVESSPLVLGGKLLVGSSDAFLYALDTTNGNLVWKYETGDKILGAPNWTRNAGKDAVLVGSYDFKLHSVDVLSGKTNWVYETGNYINGSPAVADGQTVFGGCDGLLHVIGLANGEQIKEIEAGAYVAASVALAGGHAYFGQYESQFLSIDIKEGKKTWVFQDRNFPYFSSPAVTSDRVVFGGRDKLVHCVNRETGAPLWTFPTRGKVDSSPVVCRDKVVVGSDDGRLYVLRLDKGTELWSYEVGQPVESSPAVAGGRVVIGCDDGRAYCFGTKK